MSSFVEELSSFPELSGHLTVHYADVLAQKLGQELDGLYQCVLTNTIDIIGTSYHKWIQQNSHDN